MCFALSPILLEAADSFNRRRRRREKTMRKSTSIFCNEEESSNAPHLLLTPSSLPFPSSSPGMSFALCFR